MSAANYCLKCDIEVRGDTCPQCGDPAMRRPAPAVVERCRSVKRWGAVLNGHRVRAERVTHGGREIRV